MATKKKTGMSTAELAALVTAAVLSLGVLYMWWYAEPSDGSAPL